MIRFIPNFGSDVNKGEKAPAGMDRLQAWDNVLLNLSPKEVYEIIIDRIKRKTTFTIVNDETVPYKRITAYGGRGSSKKVKAAYGMITMGLGAAADHYGSKSRYMKFYLKEAIGNQTTFKSTYEGYSAGVTGYDHKMADAFNRIHDVLEEHVVDESFSSELTDLKNKYAAGEITKEEYEQIHNRKSNPLETLKHRYATGEISKEEYEQIKRDLDL